MTDFGVMLPVSIPLGPKPRSLYGALQYDYPLLNRIRYAAAVREKKKSPRVCSNFISIKYQLDV